MQSCNPLSSLARVHIRRGNFREAKGHTQEVMGISNCYLAWITLCITWQKLSYGDICSEQGPVDWRLMTAETFLREGWRRVWAKCGFGHPSTLDCMIKNRKVLKTLQRHTEARDILGQHEKYRRQGIHLRRPEVTSVRPRKPVLNACAKRTCCYFFGTEANQRTLGWTRCSC